MNNSVRKIIKSVVIKGCKIFGVNNIFYKLNRRRKKIIAYHNVLPDNYFKDVINLEYSIKKSEFIRHLEIIKRRFDIGLDLYNADEVTITFDDGYLNQYLIASEILDKYGIKAYFFYSGDLLEDRDILSIDRIQYWLDYVKEGTYFNKKYNLELSVSDKNSRDSCWVKIQNLIGNKVSFDEVCNILNEMYSFEDININEDFYKLRFTPIKKAQLEIMKLRGHKIGAHSASHNILSNMNEDELENDINKCRELLDKGIYNTKTFCYPFGSEDEVSEDVIKCVEKNVFKDSLSFMSSKLSKLRYFKYFIPRITLPNTDNDDHIDFILSGTYYFMKNFRLFPKIVSKGDVGINYE
ncbi:polysaccharide deacetylase family sporulation protein PdaB [uncultured Clostridium sp.]|uniref:polysaccharide deacetylase family protein n=1 Tax=uncultured Clostridium sp. TaxID=59620 RepID=UPI000820ECCD|nr:polysaccharide deacetylase family protein [uncultured Clostridium sp.]SCJ39140.1 polysaccharide deacetylase family sporulation protein PdaB [uncultured Clostridium sp.]